MVLFNHGLGDKISQHDRERVKCMTPLDVFLLMFPPTHLVKIINMTNDKLRRLGKNTTTKGEMVKFFGMLLLATRYEFCSRRDLWSSRSISRMVEAPKLARRLECHATDSTNCGRLLPLATNQLKDLSK